MLNIIWLSMLFLSVIVGALEGRLDQVVIAVTDAAKFGFELALGLAAIMSLWLGIMRIATDSGLIQIFARALRPVMRRLLQKLRVALDTEGKKDNTHYYLTIAAPGGIDKINRLTSTQWQTIAETVDYIDVMTYDFHGDWDKGQTGSNFMSAMALNPTLDPTYGDPILGKYNVIDSLAAYVDQGVPPNKLVVGIPVYGRMVNIKSEGPLQGLYQPITGTPQGEWDNQQSGMTGMVDYACIVDQSMCGNNYILPHLTLVSPTDNNPGQAALTPWGYAPNVFVTYDDAQSAAYKAHWILQNHYAGAMLWDLSGDFSDTDERSIINAIYNIFNNSP